MSTARSLNRKYLHILQVSQSQSAKITASHIYNHSQSVNHSVLLAHSLSYGALFLDAGFSLRALYIIGPTGNLRHVTMNEPPVGRNPEEVLRLVQAFQYHDQHGEVCPAGWRPGQDTINTAASDKYFSKHGKE